MSIEHVFPSQVCFEDGLQISAEQPDAMVNSAAYGPPVGVRYADRTLRGYSGRFADIPADEFGLARLESFFELSPPRVGIFWISEIIDGIHRNIRCHLPGNGVRDVFAVPLASGGLITEVFLDGIPAEDWEVHHANEIQTDNACNGDGNPGSATVPASIVAVGPAAATLDVSWSRPAVGFTAFRLNPSTADVGYGIESTVQVPAVKQGETYTAGAVVLCSPGDYKVELSWDGSTAAPVSAVVSSLMSGWLYLSVNGLAPTDSTDAVITVTREHSGGRPLYVGGFHLTIGAFDSLYLPESAPVVIRFQSPPPDGAVVSVSGSGRRMARVRWGSTAVSWKQYDIGHVLPDKFSAIEVRQ